MHRFGILFIALMAGALSLGAWWEFGKPKEEKSKNQAQTDSPAAVQKSAEVVKIDSESSRQSQTEPAAAGTDAPLMPVAPRVSPLMPAIPVKALAPTEVVRVQTELQEIIARSTKLQEDIQDNRTEIRNIMERAKIHENILKTIKIPKSVSAGQIHVNSEAVVQREKVRLIAEQAKRAQKQLETIQQNRSIESQRAAS